jgi:glycosyltransferase involved in cell wall biosynthesis
LSGIIALFKLRRLFSRAEAGEAFIASVRGTVILSLLASVFSKPVPRLFVREAALYARKIWYPELSHRLALKFLYPRAKAVIAVSESVKKELVDGFSYKGHVSVVNNPIDKKNIVKLSLVSPKKTKFRFTYLSVGRLVKEKGFFYLLEAFSKISHDKTCGLYIVGAGELEERLRLRARELKIADQVVWLGYQSNPYPWYLLADVFVLSSVKEGFVNVLAEALALGVPNIVATKCGGGPEELLKHHASSWLVPPGNVEALATAMEKAKDEGKKRAVGKYCSGLTISEVIDEYLDVIDQNR